MAKSFLPTARQFDSLDRHVHSRTPPRMVAHEDSLPLELERAEIFFVVDTGVLWLVGPAGRSEIGAAEGGAFATHKQATAFRILTNSFQEVLGTTITLPTIGVYTAIAVFDFHSTAFNGAAIAEGVIAAIDETPLSPPKEALYRVTEVEDRATVVQVWEITTTTTDEQFFLMGKRSPGGGQILAEATHTTLTAFAGVGGGGSGGGTPGYVEYNSLASDLTEIQVTPVDVPGCTVTLPVAGTYVIQAAFDFKFVSQPTPATGIAGRGQLTNSSNVEEDAEAIFQHPTGSGDAVAGHRATVFQQWEITTTGANEVYKLRASKSASTAGVRVDVIQEGTTILAHSIGGGSGGGGSLPHDIQSTQHSNFSSALSPSNTLTMLQYSATAFGHDGSLGAYVPVSPSAHGPHGILLSAGPGIDITGGIISHIGNAPGDLHPIYQKESEANPDGSYGERLRRSYLLLAMDIDGFMASEA